MENLIALFIGILAGHLVAANWIKNKLKKRVALEDIEVHDAEVVEAEVVDTVYFICDFSRVEKTVEVTFETSSDARN